MKNSIPETPDELVIGEQLQIQKNNNIEVATSPYGDLTLHSTQFRDSHVRWSTADEKTVVTVDLSGKITDIYRREDQ